MKKKSEKSNKPTLLKNSKEMKIMAGGNRLHKRILQEAAQIGKMSGRLILGGKKNTGEQTQTEG